MDPNKTLIQLRNLSDQINKMDFDSVNSSTVDSIASEMSELFQELDSWITKGGFLPTDWKNS